MSFVGEVPGATKLALQWNNPPAPRRERDSVTREHMHELPGITHARATRDHTQQPPESTFTQQPPKSHTLELPRSTRESHSGVNTTLEARSAHCDCLCGPVVEMRGLPHEKPLDVPPG